ncbi:MAG: hypothetical protein AAGA77_10605 [Bacteroidota bacterium]
MGRFLHGVERRRRRGALSFIFGDGKDGRDWRDGRFYTELNGEGTEKHRVLYLVMGKMGEIGGFTRS